MHARSMETPLYVDVMWHKRICFSLENLTLFAVSI